ncbi:helix-turn-helix domain-containing protein [Paenirhodobacter ferrireducens]|nr:helix-turn-helix transcriptional regulator [Sinirhodobacter ferrireducens]
MPEQQFRFKKPRKLPGQDKLSDEQWAELADQHFAETLAEDSMDIGKTERQDELRLSENLKSLRLRLGLRQSEMADRLGVALRSLQMYETGERPPTSDFLSSLYVSFGIDLHKLFTGAPYGPSQDWKTAFSRLTLKVARHVAEAYPDLTTEEADALVTLYMGRSEGETDVDGASLMLCYDALFKPDESED